MTTPTSLVNVSPSITCADPMELTASRLMEIAEDVEKRVAKLEDLIIGMATPPADTVPSKPEVSILSQLVWTYGMLQKVQIRLSELEGKIYQ